jgi:hypothetical protein
MNHSAKNRFTTFPIRISFHSNACHIIVNTKLQMVTSNFKC